MVFNTISISHDVRLG